eukprot:m.3258 g.3258  ORF g.3258 m.3258 type:complete len:79 (+) comp9197_c0_seq1:402-638(+)
MKRLSNGGKKEEFCVVIPENTRSKLGVFQLRLFTLHTVVPWQCSLLPVPIGVARNWIGCGGRLPSVGLSVKYWRNNVI